MSVYIGVYYMVISHNLSVRIVYYVVISQDTSVYIGVYYMVIVHNIYL